MGLLTQKGILSERVVEHRPAPSLVEDRTALISPTMVADFFDAPLPALQDNRSCLIGPVADLYYCACRMVEPMTRTFAAEVLSSVHEAGAYAAGEKRSRIGAQEARETVSVLCERWQEMAGVWASTLDMSAEIDPFAEEEEVFI